MLAAALVVALATSPSAAAATQLGQIFGSPAGCDTNQILLNGSPGSAQYIAPSRGVITSWSFQAGASPPTLKLKVARPAGANTFTIVGQSVLQAPAPNVVSSFPTRVPMETGDVLGFFVGASGGCSQFGAATTLYQFFQGAGQPSADLPPGSTATFTQASNIQLDISAILEPDADNDGFGDETQDQCPTSAATQNACVPPVTQDLCPTSAATQNECVPPETQITKKPKDKTRNKIATFEFTSSEPGSTFQCKVDGEAQFKPCGSPFTVKVKRGKHTFQVQATDQAGNADSSAATDDWKVKKKK